MNWKRIWRIIRVLQLGYNLLTEKQIIADMEQTGHACIVGGTGSGKSVATMYLLYQLLKNYNAKITICDFKKSGDYEGISDDFAEFSDVTECIETYYEDYQNTPENNPQIKLLLIDEYAGYIIWATQNDKKKSEKVKQVISEVLMCGRSRNCFIWIVLQRISASLFPAGIGAIDNFQICMGLGRLSVESRKSLFAGEHLDNASFEERYHPKTGQGLVLIDGQELQPIQIPYIADKTRLKQLLQRMAKEKAAGEGKPR
ncbi:MAG: DUF87 domain-containing protein [Butyrivibrio sp.]|nr:DUF87 domain-containing protein [Butyrivibrio sp.]